MLISQILKIGEIYYKDTSNIKVMLGYQNSIKPQKKGDIPKILLFKINCSNPEEITYDFEIKEYKENLDEKYLLGLAGGASANYSLTLSTGWNKKEYKDEEKFKKTANSFWKKITVIRKKDSLKEFFVEEGAWIKNILEDIKSNAVQLFAKLESFFSKRGETSFKYPIISQIKRKSEFNFLGEIPEMRRMYQILFFLKLIPKGGEQLFCRICNSNKNLVEAFKLGMYSTTHSSFVMGFFSQFKGLYGQNIMCNECYLKTLYGFNFIQKNLNFYAYKLKNSRSSDSIYHFIIPMMKDEDLLKKAIKLISRAKKATDERLKKSIENQINSINQKIDRIKLETKKSAKKRRDILTKEKIKKKNLEKELKKENNSVDVDILIETLGSSDNHISILDLYYKITNVKQNPKTIEVVSDILLTSEMIEQLSKIFRLTWNEFGKVALSDLKRLVEDRFFLQYYSSLLGLKQQSKELFNERSVDLLKKYFLQDFAKLDYYGLKGKEKYYYLLDIYDRFDFMYNKANLWV